MNQKQPGHIAESELIITPKGTVYHIDLAPQHLAPTVITVGDPARVKQVSKHFDSIEHKAAHREFISHTGYLGNKKITVISTGIGPDNIDIVLNELDALVNVDFETRTVKPEKTSLQIIRLGTSGSLKDFIDVDSLVVASFGLGLDNLLHYYVYASNPEELFILNDFKQHTALNKGPLIPYIAEGSIQLRNLFAQHGFHHGITVTCPGFYAPQGRVVRATLSQPHLIDALTTFTSRGQYVTNFEMETSAIYGLGKIFGHQCLSINTIVANRINKTFSKDGYRAVENMITRSLQIIADS